jgi:UrcA family protein
MNLAKIACAAALALGLQGFGAAHAEDNSSDGYMIVRLDGLDLGSSRGAEIALRRIKAASLAFCGQPYRDLSQIAAQHACIVRMTGKAVDQLNAPRVSELYGVAPRVEVARSTR